MPIYKFEDTKTKEEWEEQMSYDDLLIFLEKNKHINQIFVINLGDPAKLGLKKTDNAFRQKMQILKNEHAGSTINTGNLGEI